MVAPAQKRRSDSRPSHQGHKKRQKVDKRTNGRDKVCQAVSLDQLEWKEVPMPDRLEDVEGFFGLEEIDDVEVVKREGDGTVEYRLVAGDAVDVKPTSMPSKNGLFEGDWEGFGDFATAIEGHTEELGDKSNTPRKEREKNKRKEKKDRSKHEKATEGPQNPVNAFESLHEEALDDEADVSAWEALNLSFTTLSSLAKLGFTKPTPIQSAAIPPILAGHDVIGKASTGSGKTLSFGIPILEHFRERKKDSPTALILSPTRELAHQLSTHLTALFSSVASERPSIATITGGLSLQKQQRLLETADVVIGTPGRLWEIMSAGHGLMDWFRRVKFLVIDEADRLLSEGHYKEFEDILNVLDRDEDDKKMEDVERQTLIFSATFHKGLHQKLAGKGKTSGSSAEKDSLQYLLKRLNFREDKPKFVDVNPISQMASRLKEGMVECAALEKDLYLYAVLMHYPNQRTLIFTNSISSVRRLTPLLQSLDVPAHALHSQMPQKARMRSIERFSGAKNSVLVATDVAARGLDIPGVQLILHYHLPRAADAYVHRSGRTARATLSGTSILLCAPSEVPSLRRLIAKVHASPSSSTGNNHFIRTMHLNPHIVSRLKPRLTVAKKLADASLAKEKHAHEGSWLRTAAEDLGVDYESDDFEHGGKTKGRGTGRAKAAKEARALTKGEAGALRAELKSLLAQKVNVGVSERYLTSGSVDVDALLEGREGGRSGGFLGTVDDVGFDDA